MCVRALAWQRETERVCLNAVLLWNEFLKRKIICTILWKLSLNIGQTNANDSADGNDDDDDDDDDNYDYDGSGGCDDNYDIPMNFCEYNVCKNLNRCNCHFTPPHSCDCCYS